VLSEMVPVSFAPGWENAIKGKEKSITDNSAGKSCFPMAFGCFCLGMQD